jgi:hypothetical protein
MAIYGSSSTLKNNKRWSPLDVHVPQLTPQLATFFRNAAPLEILFVGVLDVLWHQQTQAMT